MFRIFSHVFPCFMPFSVLGWWLGLYSHILVWRCWLCFARIYVFVSFLPCFMLKSTSIHSYLLGFMFLHVYVLSFHIFIRVLPYLCLDLCFHMLMCLDLCFHVLVCLGLCFHLLVFLGLCFHMLVCLDLCFHVLVCLDLCFYMLVSLLICSMCFMLSFIFLCTLCHVCVLRPRLCSSCQVLL